MEQQAVAGARCVLRLLDFMREHVIHAERAKQWEKEPRRAACMPTDVQLIHHTRRSITVLFTLAALSGWTRLELHICRWRKVYIRCIWLLTNRCTPSQSNRERDTTRYWEGCRIEKFLIFHNTEVTNKISGNIDNRIKATPRCPCPLRAGRALCQSILHSSTIQSHQLEMILAHMYVAHSVRLRPSNENPTWSSYIGNLLGSVVNSVDGVGRGAFVLGPLHYCPIAIPLSCALCYEHFPKWPVNGVN